MVINLFSSFSLSTSYHLVISLGINSNKASSGHHKHNFSLFIIIILSSVLSSLLIQHHSVSIIMVITLFSSFSLSTSSSCHLRCHHKQYSIIQIMYKNEQNSTIIVLYPLSSSSPYFPFLSLHTGTVAWDFKCKLLTVPLIIQTFIMIHQLLKGTLSRDCFEVFFVKQSLLVMWDIS